MLKARLGNSSRACGVFTKVSEPRLQTPVPFASATGMAVPRGHEFGAQGDRACPLFAGSVAADSQLVRYGHINTPRHRAVVGQKQDDIRKIRLTLQRTRYRGRKYGHNYLTLAMKSHPADGTDFLRPF